MRVRIGGRAALQQQASLATVSVCADEIRGTSASLGDAGGDVRSAREVLPRLVAEAAAGRLEPVIGRDSEIRRTIKILSRKTKNNPV